MTQAARRQREKGGERLSRADALQLRYLRTSNGLTLEAVAQAAEMDPSWLSLAERGYRPMTETQADALRTAIADLVVTRDEENAAQ